MFRLNHRSIKVTLFSEIHIKIISKISLTYHQIAFLSCYAINIAVKCILHEKSEKENIKFRKVIVS